MASGSYSSTWKGYTVKTDWSSVMDIAGNYSTVTCDHYLICKSGWDLYIGNRTLTCTAGETKSFTAGSISQGTGGGTHKLGTTTHKVEHDSNGSKTITATTNFSFKATISNEYKESISATGTMTLDDIPRASSLSANNGTLGTSTTLTIDKADDSFTHTITYTCGTASGTVPNATKTTADSVSWTPPLSLASQSPSLSKVTVTYTITTYSGDTAVGTSTATASYTIPSSTKPTATLSVSDATSYKSTYGAYVQNKSKFKVTVTGTPIYSSPISSYSTSINGGTPYTASSFTTDVIKDAGTYNIVASVTDSRGNTGTDTESVTVLEYSPPIVSFTASRCDDNWIDDVEGKNVRIDWFATVSNLNGKNNLSATLKYGKTGSGEYITRQDVVNEAMGTSTGRGLQYVLTDLDENSSYEFELIVTDNLSTTTKYASIPSIFTFFHFDGPTTDGVGKNKLNLLDAPFADPASGDDLGYTFVNDILTLDYVGTSNIYDGVSYKIPDVKKGDILRFKTVISNSNAFVRISLITTNTDADGTLIAELNEEFRYIDGLTATEVEHTVQNNIFACYVFFGLDHNNTTGPISGQFKRPILTINDKDTSYERYLLGVEPSLGIGKMAELPNGVDFGLKAKFNKGFVAPILQASTDLNTIMEPNFYAGGDASTFGYSNCPVTTGTFHLEVVSSGNNGQLQQKVTSCDKANSVTYERYYYGSSWGTWIKQLDSLNLIYPVGSIYMSVNSTSPQTLFGGTWTRIQDVFLLAAGSTYSAGSTGGKAKVTLTVDEMPKHTHIQNQHRHSAYNYNSSGADCGWNRAATAGSGGTGYVNLGTNYATATNQDTGGDQPHENMPPYLAVYMWKRTA